MTSPLSVLGENDGNQDGLVEYRSFVNNISHIVCVLFWCALWTFVSCHICVAINVCLDMLVYVTTNIIISTSAAISACSVLFYYFNIVYWYVYLQSYRCCYYVYTGTRRLMSRLGAVCHIEASRVQACTQAAISACKKSSGRRAVARHRIAAMPRASLLSLLHVRSRSLVLILFLGTGERWGTWDDGNMGGGGRLVLSYATPLPRPTRTKCKKRFGKTSVQPIRTNFLKRI